MSWGDIIFVSFLGLILYILAGGLCSLILSDFCKWRDDDSIIICSIFWPATALFWACAGFVLFWLYIPKFVVVTTIRLVKKRLGSRGKSGRIVK